MTRHPELPERDRRILGALVQAYIDYGEPISSLWLASRGFGVSSATLRNIMARLEELGYVRQPHTSAGRVPTDMGYRSYVDQIMADRRVARSAPDVEERLRRAGTVEDVLSHASQEISRASHQVGFAMIPATEATFEHLDFAPLDGRRVLVVLVSTGGHISHKVIEPTEPFGITERKSATGRGDTIALDDYTQVMQGRSRPKQRVEQFSGKARVDFNTLFNKSGQSGFTLNGDERADLIF